MKTLFAIGALAISLSAFFYVEKQAQAQALQLAKPFTGKVNKAIASSLGKRLNTMGFAANDPIYTATLATAETVVQGSIAAGSVAATVAAIGSAPVWLSVALGVGAVYEVYDFTVGQFEYKAVPSAPAVQLSQGTVFHAPPIPAPFSGEWSTPPVDLPYNYADPGVGNRIDFPNDQKICAITTSPSATVCGNTVQELEDQARTLYAHNLITVQGSFGATITGNTLTASAGPTKLVCTLSSINCPEGIRYTYTRNYQTAYVQYGEPGTFNTSFSFSVFNNPSFVDSTKLYTLNDAAARLGDTDLAARADPELLAAIANKIWQQAAQQPDYQGAPYDVQNPVTAADILADVAAGLYPHPTNYDLLSLPSPNPETVVELDPDAVPVPETASDSVTVDLGPDPGTASPSLEDAPTGSTIVAHVMGLLPALSAFSIPAHVSSCEMPSFDFFGNEMSMDPGCDVIETQRDLLSTLFSAIWGVSALMFVLRA